MERFYSISTQQHSERSEVVDGLTGPSHVALPASSSLSSASASASSSSSFSGPEVLRVRSTGPSDAFTTPPLAEDTRTPAPQQRTEEGQSMSHQPSTSSKATATESFPSRKSLQAFDFGLAQSLAGTPLPESPADSASKLTTSTPLEENVPPRVGDDNENNDTMPQDRDVERAIPRTAEHQQQPSRKRPFSFVVANAPRWTWVNALILGIALVAAGSAVAAIVLSVRPHGRGHGHDHVGVGDVASVGNSAVASSTTTTGSDTGYGGGQESRSSARLRSVSPSLTSMLAVTPEVRPTPFSSPSVLPTLLSSAAPSTTTTPTILPLPAAANGAADANPPAAPPASLASSSTPSQEPSLSSIPTAATPVTFDVSIKLDSSGTTLYIPPPSPPSPTSQTSTPPTPRPALFASGSGRPPFFPHPAHPPFYGAQGERRGGRRGGLPGPVAGERWAKLHSGGGGHLQDQEERQGGRCCCR